MKDEFYEPLKFSTLGFGEYKKYKWAITIDEDGDMEAYVQCCTDIDRHHDSNVIDIIETRDTIYRRCYWNKEDYSNYFGWYYLDKELTYNELKNIIYKVIDYLDEEGIN